MLSHTASCQQQLPTRPGTRLHFTTFSCLFIFIDLFSAIYLFIIIFIFVNKSLLDLKVVRSEPDLRQTAMVSLASFFRMACIDRLSAESRFPSQYLNFSSGSRREVWPERLVARLAVEIRDGESGDRSAALSALNILGHPSLIPVVLPLIEGEVNHLPNQIKNLRNRGRIDSVYGLLLLMVVVAYFWPYRHVNIIATVGENVIAVGQTVIDCAGKKRKESLAYPSVAKKAEKLNAGPENPRIGIDLLLHGFFSFFF